MGLEPMERLRFLASLPLAGTAQTEGRGTTIMSYPISLFESQPELASTYKSRASKSSALAVGIDRGMIESGDERGKWDKKGAREGGRGTFHGEMGKWQKMAQAMTLMKRMGGREGETSNGPIH